MNNFFLKNNNKNMYFNYHAKIKRLIDGGHLVKYEFIDKYKNISPCLVLYFENHIPMPVREHKFEMYDEILNKFEVANNAQMTDSPCNDESE